VFAQLNDMVFIRSNNIFQVPTTCVYIFILLFYLDGPGSNMFVSPSEGPFTKTQCQRLGPIVSSAHNVTLHVSSIG
jgi:hypothetical protein